MQNRTITSEQTENFYSIFALRSARKTPSQNICVTLRRFVRGTASRRSQRTESLPTNSIFPTRATRCEASTVCLLLSTRFLPSAALTTARSKLCGCKERFTAPKTKSCPVRSTNAFAKRQKKRRMSASVSFFKRYAVPASVSASLHSSPWRR